MSYCTITPHLTEMDMSYCTIIPHLTERDMSYCTIIPDPYRDGYVLLYYYTSPYREGYVLLYYYTSPYREGYVLLYYYTSPFGTERDMSSSVTSLAAAFHEKLASFITMTSQSLTADTVTVISELRTGNMALELLTRAAT